MQNYYKKYFFSNPKFLTVVSFLFNSINLFRIRSSSLNELHFSCAFLLRTQILVKKQKNIIHIYPGSYLNNCSIKIYGYNNSVIIKENCSLRNVEIHIEDNNNKIIIGQHTTIAGFTHLACIEGTKIIIGGDCMFSKDITFRTGDSHSIIDENEIRINPSEDIIIGNHVWIGNKVIITKGTFIGDNSIVGTGSIVTKAFEKPNVIVAGSPAKIVKENINWLRDRI